MRSLFNGTRQLTSDENKVLARRVRAGDERARQRMIEGNTGFAYKRAFKYAQANHGWGHIDSEDILQSALMGLIEAVDRYDPDKLNEKTGRPYAFTTFAHWWILKRINEEVWTRHWNTMRPPRHDMRAFLYRRMDYDATSEYVEQYMYRGGDKPLESKDFDEGFIQAEILSAVEQAGLTDLEMRVFNSLYGANPEEDKLDDLPRKIVAELEESFLVKLREQFE